MPASQPVSEPVPSPILLLVLSDPTLETSSVSLGPSKNRHQGVLARQGISWGKDEWKGREQVEVQKTFRLWFRSDSCRRREVRTDWMGRSSDPSGVQRKSQQGWWRPQRRLPLEEPKAGRHGPAQGSTPCSDCWLNHWLGTTREVVWVWVPCGFRWGSWKLSINCDPQQYY